MSLQSAIIAYVDSATPQNDAQYRAQLVDKLLNSGELYLDSGDVLCVRACSHATADIRTSSLPTRISGDANTVLTALRELADVGLLTGSGLKLWDEEPGVTVQVIP